MEASARVYRQALGVRHVEFETVETEGVRVAILRLENGRIELMQPTSDSSPIKRFLDKKGQGLHHVALQTDDIDGEVSRMEGCGIRFLGKVRPGSEGTRITFVHPKSLEGVLAELCSVPAGATDVADAADTAPPPPSSQPPPSNDADPT